MPAHATQLAEGLATASATVRFLLRVDGAVPLQVAGGDETLPAQRAVVTSLPRVDEQVDPQVIGLSEALSTVLAAVRPLTCVGPLVHL